MRKSHVDAGISFVGKLVTALIAARTSVGAPLIHVRRRMRRHILSSISVLAALLCVTSVVATPASAQAGAHHARPAHKGHGGAFSKAVAKARRVHHRVHVRAMDGATTTTYAHRDGTATIAVTQVPTRVSRGSRYVGINRRLQPTAGGYRAAATSDPVQVSDGGDSTVASVGGAGKSVGLDWGGGALPSPTVDGDQASYDISKSSTLDVNVNNDGFSADVVLSSAPGQAPTYTFPLELSGLTAKAASDGGVQFFDSHDVEQYAIPGLRMWDSTLDAYGDPANDVPVDATLTSTADGPALVVKPDMAYLQDPGTQYPVTIDPTVIGAGLSGTTEIWNKSTGGGGNSTSLSDQYNMQVGASDGVKTYRSYVLFGVGRFEGEQVLNASMKLWQYGAGGNCTAQQMNVAPASRRFDFGDSSLNPTLWGNQPGVVANADRDWTVQHTFNTGGTQSDGVTPCPGQPNGWDTIDVTNIVAGWAAGSIPDAGFRLSPPGTTDNYDPKYFKNFCSSNPTNPTHNHCYDNTQLPTLNVTVPGADLGLRPNADYITHTLNDRSSIMANLRDGNVVVQNRDINIRALGQDMNVDRYYNSQSTTTGAFGLGWQMSVGPDVTLQQYDNNTPSTRVDYNAPNGSQYGSFILKQDGSNDYYSITNGGLNADLHYDSPSGDYKLTFHGSKEEYWFAPTNSGCLTCGWHMVKMKDRHGNAITYQYSGALLTSITDPANRNLTFAYDPTYTSQVASITDSTGRQWKYSYDSAGMLKSYTDPGNNETDYGYASSELQTITDPAGSDATQERPTTTIGYVLGGFLNALKYSRDGSSSSVYEFDFTYYSKATLPATCDTSDDFAMQVTDVSDSPSGTTTYCFAYAHHTSDNTNYPSGVQGPQEQVHDADGNKRSDEFTPDGGVATDTSAANATAGASTVNSYDTTHSDNLTKTVEPSDDGTQNDGGTTYYGYGDASNPNQPTSVQTSQGTCTGFKYNAVGDLEHAYTNLTPDSQHHCDPQTTSTTGKNDFEAHHNTNGTVAWTATPEADHSNTSQRTQYGYYSTTGTNAGQVKTVTEPGGTAPPAGSTCAVGAKLCTGFTYDTLDRVTKVTYGNGVIKNFAYDKEDRVTAVYLDGDTSCNSGHTDCFTYTYDGEGNLTGVTDNNNKVRYLAYDRLNRLTSVTVPTDASGSQPLFPEQLVASYDGAGDLISYQDKNIDNTNGSNDTVNYNYDAAHQLVSLTDAAGTSYITNFGDGRRHSIQYPSGTKITYSYRPNGQYKEISSGTTTITPYDLKYFYGAGSTQTDQLTHVQDVANNTDSYFGYDHQDRLCWKGTVAFTNAADDSGCNQTSHMSHAYQYDKNGDLTQDITPSTTKYYGYDLAGELCWGGTSAPTGSIPAVMTGGCTGSAPGTDRAFDSDNAGNWQGPSGGHLATYTDDNQVASQGPFNGGSLTSMGYDDQGNDLRTTVGSDTLYNGPIGVTALKNSTGRTFYTRDPQGRLVDERTPSGTYYYIADNKGSTIALVDNSHTTQASYSYDSYGALTNTTSAIGQANPWRYDGGYQDIEGDNLYHFGARYYNPATGSFTQPDSVRGDISAPHTIDRYAYAGGDPLNASDPSGQTSIFGGVLDAVSVGAGLIGTLATGGLLGAGLIGVSAAASAGSAYLSGASSSDVAAAGLLSAGAGGLGSLVGGVTGAFIDLAGIGSGFQLFGA